MNTKKHIKGGEWLVTESEPLDIFTVEDFDEEQTMILGLCNQFVDTVIFPNSNSIDNMDKGVMPDMLKKTGDQGLLGAAVPEAYGGMGKDFIVGTIVTMGLSSNPSYSTALAAHMGIGTLPILYFGTEEQKKKYIPKILTGEWASSYGLTEPNSGSDALSSKTTAKLSADKKFYVLNGQKCWITNGGFSHVFTVFAKIDGEQFTAFIVERGTPGFTQGQEEHKMGLKGSSTVQLFFQDCKVPVENVLGEVGRGHIIAFNILNIGRLKLSAAATGAINRYIPIITDYALTREQFKTPIAQFGAIQFKLAQMVIKKWVNDAALFRTADLIAKKEHELIESGVTFNKAVLGAAEEYAIECALLKVFGSETLNYVVDEGVQIHGGNGFSDEYAISKYFRDARINRIFEGTNEINRLLSFDMLMKKALKGKLDLMTPALAVQKELMSIPDLNTGTDTPFSKELGWVKNFKKATLLIAGAAAQKLATQLEKEQEIVMNIADMLLEVFTAESALLRCIKSNVVGKNPAMASLHKDIALTYLYEASFNINKLGSEAVSSFAEGDELRLILMGLKRFTKVDPYNAKEARRRIVKKLLSEKKYCF
ncbi:MAG: acyl-CoA dehydrogenase family protein [Phycisphaerales bacterium]|nr:acyl-CoA dehydrogenase family protein [Phycisphaerales bacterium]